MSKAALDLHENISDAIEDAVEDVRGYLGLEVVEEGLEAMKRRTKFVRRIVLKGIVGTYVQGQNKRGHGHCSNVRTSLLCFLISRPGVAMLLYGLHFSHLVVFAHTVRQTGQTRRCSCHACGVRIESLLLQCHIAH